eukprot:gnl/TRDRNA2_/TRDRNA2_80850_c0_seq1.p1 gnl/TRDRNA2_/TRDRNA2_80850_c0~~gnl/TRDRNA2_/TRDRNA2_80850_c0_seq1.p1  ORF type:complete len:309 (-),score=14.37 gnl/TRDRNA2_/TRDRNA2_80850_c0_seq1:137-979(-)
MATATAVSPVAETDAVSPAPAASGASARRLGINMAAPKAGGWASVASSSQPLPPSSPPAQATRPRATAQVERMLPSDTAPNTTLARVLYAPDASEGRCQTPHTPPRSPPRSAPSVAGRGLASRIGEKSPRVIPFDLVPLKPGGERIGSSTKLRRPVPGPGFRNEIFGPRPPRISDTGQLRTPRLPSKEIRTGRPAPSPRRPELWIHGEILDVWAHGADPRFHAHSNRVHYTPITERYDPLSDCTWLALQRAVISNATERGVKEETVADAEAALQASECPE